MRVAALGRSRMLSNSIESLVLAGHQVSLIATCKSAPEYEVNEEDFRRMAAELGAGFISTQDLNHPDSIVALRAASADIAVSVNWINIVGVEACQSFPFGILNAHAGDLPRYRGNAPVAWAILQGEEKIGITVHQMNPHELDAGAIVLKDYFPLSEDTYIGEVFEYLEHRIPDMFVAAVNGLSLGTIIPQLQLADPALSLRCYPRRPEDGLICWQDPALTIARLVRASSEPFAGAFTFFRGKRLTIWRARLEPWRFPALAMPGQIVWRDRESQEVGVATGDGVLVIEEAEWGEDGPCRPAIVIKSLRDRMGSIP